MYTYVCMHMREGLVTACIDMYELGGQLVHTPKGHGVQITTLTPLSRKEWFAYPLCYQHSHPTLGNTLLLMRVNK